MDFDITVGTASKAELLAQLDSAGIQLNEYARRLFSAAEFATSAEERRVALRSVSLPELGLQGGATYAEIVSAANGHRLAECPLEAAVHLRLAYLDQPVGPYLTVASSEPRPGTEFPNGFYLRHLEDGLWLRGYESGPENRYAPDFSDFVFTVAR